MASFDFVECSAKAYRFVWNGRAGILNLSLMALALKVVSFMTVTALGLESNLLRQGLVLLPSQLLEGLVICRIMVLATTLEVEKDGSAMILGDSPSIRAGAIVYALIKLLLSFVIGMTFMEHADVASSQAASSGPDPQILMLAILILAGMVWVFRYLWLYVPVSLGYGIEDFSRKFKGFSSSLSMIGLWILCFTPLAFLLILCSEILGHLIPGARDDLPSIVYLQAMAVVQAFFDYAISLVSSIGMAYGIRSVFNNENKKTSIF